MRSLFILIGTTCRLMKTLHIFIFLWNLKYNINTKLLNIFNFFSTLLETVYIDRLEISNDSRRCFNNTLCKEGVSGFGWTTQSSSWDDVFMWSGVQPHPLELLGYWQQPLWGPILRGSLPQTNKKLDLLKSCGCKHLFSCYVKQ